MLGRPIEGAARVVLRHERRSTFRWVGILEWILALACFVCVLPIVLLLLLFTGGGPDLPEMNAGDGGGFGRLYHWWHDVVVTVLGPDGRVWAEGRHTPTSADEGRGIVAAVLAAADRHGIVVVETIGAGAAEVVEVWYGGRPLLAHPEAHDERAAVERLRGAGMEVADGDEELAISREVITMGKVGAVIILVLFGWFVFPLSFVSKSMRDVRTRLMWDLKGANKPRHTISVRADRVVSRTERVGHELGKTEMAGRELIAVAFSPTLGYDKQVSRHQATLRLVGTHANIELDTPKGDANVGRALRDAIVAATLRLRAAHPELGLHGDRRATRCPYCGTLYAMEPGTKCPQCGAPAGSI